MQSSSALSAPLEHWTARIWRTCGIDKPKGVLLPCDTHGVRFMFVGVRSHSSSRDEKAMSNLFDSIKLA